MTKLSVNLNKIALLRNSRGRDYPSVTDFARRFIDLGVHGITVHPRPDERHIKRRDAFELGELLADHPHIEFNIEGYPSEDFLQMVVDIRPDQCTMVPDEPGQLTSDHGWDVARNSDALSKWGQRLRDGGVRSAAFLDADCEQVERISQTGVDRIELYTEAFASAFGGENGDSVLADYRSAALLAQRLGVGVNAGHDLDSRNLAAFLSIGGILEVSIGHALTVECIEEGMENVIARYLAICDSH